MPMSRRVPPDPLADRRDWGGYPGRAPDTKIPRQASPRWRPRRAGRRPRADPLPAYATPTAIVWGAHRAAGSLYAHAREAGGGPVRERAGPASPAPVLDALKPYRDGLVVGCECMFAWYWLADLCEREAIPFVLGHALAMKAIHGGKAKNDKLDAHKIAGLLKGGFFPMAHVYPKAKRDTRDLLRRRSFFVRQRAQLFAHIQNTNSQYNLPPFDKKLTYKGNRSAEIAERFEHPSTRLSITTDLNLIES